MEKDRIRVIAVTEKTAEERIEAGRRKTAAELLERCREFYRDPENERAFQEWKAAGRAAG